MIKYPYLFKRDAKINLKFDFFYTNFDWKLDLWLPYFTKNLPYEQDYW